jgi:cobalt/nickel transport protein
MDRKNLIIAGVVIALAIAVAAPFIASGNPDGLESAFFGIFGAKEIHGESLDEHAAASAEEKVTGITGNTFEFASPFPDYTLEGLAKPGESLVIALGVLVVLVAGFGLGKVLTRDR